MAYNAHSSCLRNNYGTHKVPQSLRVQVAAITMLLQIIGGTIVLGSLYYMSQSLIQDVKEPDLEIDMATSPLDRKDLIDEEDRWLQMAKPPINEDEQTTLQQSLNRELLALRQDYIPHPPAFYGDGGPLMGPDSVYRGDYNDYDFVNREA